MSVADDFGLPGEGEQTPAAGQQQETGSGLRKQLEAALMTNKALQERATALEAKARQSDIATLVKDAGLPDAAAGRYPADAEVTPEKVKEWADAEKAYAQQLAGTPAGTTAPPGPTPPAGIGDGQQLTMQQVAEAAAGAAAPSEGLEGMLARLRDPSVSWPTLQAEMKALGFKDG